MNSPWKHAMLWMGLLAYGFFFLDWAALLEMKAALLKTAVYLGLLAWSPILVVLAIGFLRGRWKLVMVPSLFHLSIFAMVGPLEYLNRMSVWETQTVLHRHGHFPFLRIEYQVHDEGTFGFEERTVKVAGIANLLSVPMSFDSTETRSPEWIATDTFVNEAGWK